MALLPIFVGVFVIAWAATIGGAVVYAVQWRSFQRGGSNAAARGLVLSSQLAKARFSTFERVGNARLDLSGRVVSHEILLFPRKPPHACSDLNPCRLPWFGRAVLRPDGVLIEARIPLGLMMFVGGWLAMAFTMALMLLVAEGGVIAVIVGAVAMSAVVGYWYTFARERQAATRFVSELNRDIASAG